jgi:hypothetical protein
MQPVRSADYPAHPPLSRLLTLPPDTETVDASSEEVLAAWSDYLGWSGPLLVVADPDRARRLLTEACGVRPGDPVGVPANARRFLAEAVKRAGGKPRYVELAEDLGFAPETPGLDEIRLVWAQPVGGMAPPEPPPGATMLVDHGLTLPAPLAAPGAGLAGAATLWGLHLSEETAASGALVAFADAALADRFAALLTEEDRPDPGRALAQARRLGGEDGLAARLLAVDREVRLGMEAGAGLPMAPRADGALPWGVPVRIPDEADAPTFVSYVRNELVGLDWAPEVQPMNYVAFQTTRNPALTRRSAERLARWVVSPLGPDFVDDEVTHAVLGLLKAAEYTGVRWYTNPGRARWYGERMVEWYGPDHDAYRPAFAIGVPARE